MTQPDVYIGFTPSLDAGHGNHQMAGRYIWEGVKAAADPNMFPEQLTGPERAQHLAGQEGLLGRLDRAGTGGHDVRPPTAPPASCPPRPTWTRSRASGPATTRRTCGRPATSRAARGHARRSGRRSRPRAARAYPTQSRVMNQRTSTPGCSRFGMTDSFVPFQPNAERRRHRQRGRRQGRRDPLRRDRSPTRADCPLGTLEYLSFSRFFNTPGTPFTATVNLQVGRRHAGAPATSR